MASASRSRVLGTLVGILLAAVAGVAAWDHLGAEEVLFHEVDWRATPRHPETLAVRCADRPIGGVEYRLDGIGWSAALPRAGVVRTLDARWALVELAEDAPPCEPRGGTSLAERLAVGVEAVDFDPEMSDRRERDVGSTDGPHRASTGGWRRPTRVAGTLEPSPRTICLVSRSDGLRFCAETSAAVSDAMVAGFALVLVHATAPVTLTARSLDDGHALFGASIPTDAAEVWLEHTDGTRVGVRANEHYFVLDATTGALDRLTPDGGEACTEGSFVAITSAGALLTSGADPFVVSLVAAPGEGWRVASCTDGRDGEPRHVQLLHPGRPWASTRSDPVTDFRAPLEGVEVDYTLDLEGAVIGAVHTH